MHEHAGLPVPGYRPQSDTAVSMVAVNKELEERVLRLLDELGVAPGVDRRWLAIGRTHIEQGWMAVNRAIFKPERVDLGAPAVTTGKAAGLEPATPHLGAED